MICSHRTVRSRRRWDHEYLRAFKKVFLGHAMRHPFHKVPEGLDNEKFKRTIPYASNRDSIFWMRAVVI